MKDQSAHWEQQTHAVVTVIVKVQEEEPVLTVCLLPLLSRVWLLSSKPSAT